MKLAGKVALVTSSSQRIEQNIVLRLAEAGADVVINYRSHLEGAEETLAKVQAIGGRCHIAQGSDDVELESMGITINNVAPGAIETSINTQLLNTQRSLEQY